MGRYLKMLIAAVLPATLAALVLQGMLSAPDRARGTVGAPSELRSLLAAIDFGLEVTGFQVIAPGVHAKNGRLYRIFVSREGEFVPYLGGFAASGESIDGWVAVVAWPQHQGADRRCFAIFPNGDVVWSANADVSGGASDVLGLERPPRPESLFYERSGVIRPAVNRMSATGRMWSLIEEGESKRVPSGF